MKRPEFVTFTGLDESVDMVRLHDISRRYPVEWGVLFSKERTGKEKRFPALKFVEHFYLNSGLRLSAHICGLYSREIMHEAKMKVPEISGMLTGNFGRVQINIAGTIEPRRAVDFGLTIGANPILQCRGFFPASDSVDWLLDKSGGRGETPQSWYARAENSPAFCGYAGGIGPDNIEQVLGILGEMHPDGKRFWIDMENNIRTHDFIDLDKCEAVLKAVYPAAPSLGGKRGEP